MIIAGIGSRDTPQNIRTEMTAIGTWCRQESEQNKTPIWVRSGHAEGADEAFEIGARGYCIAYLPNPTFRKEFQVHGAIYHTPVFTRELMILAQKYHPAWHRCDERARKLHARNGCQVLGEKLNSPVDFVVCWTVDGEATGGTGQAIRIATDHDITVLNMKKPEYNTAAKVIDILLKKSVEQE